jgi:hypothetical protein
MRRLTVLFGLLLGLSMLSTAGSAEITDHVLWVENQTGKAIHGLHISPVESDDWEEDVLGDDLLPHGERVEIHLSGYNEDQCLFDLLATNPDGTSWVLPAIDLCRIFSVTLAPRHQT